jgi:hypothetical protein
MFRNQSEVIDFAKLKISRKPVHSYTVIPLECYRMRFQRLKDSEFRLDPSVLQYANDKHAPIFKKITAKELARQWQRLMSKQVRVSLVFSDEKKLKYCYCQRTKLLGLSDYITVQFLNLEDMNDTCCTLVIHSQSKWSWLNSGANEERIKQWLQELQEQINTLTNKTSKS